MESDENFGYQFSENRTEPNRPQNSKTENSVSAVQFSKNRYPRFWDGFSRCLIHNSSSKLSSFFSVTVSKYCILLMIMEFCFVFVWLCLRNSKLPAPQPLRTRAAPWTGGEVYTHGDRRLPVK